MTNDAVQKQYYLDIEGEQVAVSKEVYLAYMQPVWREQKRQERQKRCIDENGRRCMRDCSQCPRTPLWGSFVSGKVHDGRVGLFIFRQC